MTSLVTQIKDFVAQADSRYLEARRRIMDKAAHINQEKGPTIDRHGRLHAPCDGYEWEDVIYQGGSYLPFPPEFYEMLEMTSGYTPKDFSSFGFSSRIKSSPTEVAAIKEACGAYAEVSAGKTWDNDQVCYCYIKTTRKGLDALLSDYQAEQERLIEEAREAEKAAKRALKGVAPTGRLAVRGTVLALKEVERESYSYYDSGWSYKMLVELENKATVWGTVPSKISSVEIGDTIEFTAGFEQASDDDTHAFYKRPSKASIIKRAEAC